MKKIYLFFFLIFILQTSLQAQYCDTVSFQKIIWNKGVHDAIIKNMFYGEDDNIYAIGSTESAINHNKDIWVMKFTRGGNIIWSKAIGLSKDETVNGIRRTSDKGFIIAGSTTSLSTFNEGIIIKIDSNAAVQWSLAVGPQYSNLLSVTQLNDNGYIAAGTLYTDFSGDSSGNVTSINKSTNIVLRLDANGKLMWWKSFRFNNTEGLKTSAQAKDGSLLVTGVEDETNDGYVIKLDKDNGAIQWMNGYKSLKNNASPRAVSQSDKTIHLQVGNRIFFLTADGKFFDGRKIELNSSKLNLDNVPVGNFGSISSDKQMYDANLYPKHSPILFAVQNDSVVVWAHEYKQTADNLQRITNAFVHNQNIYIAGSYMANNISDNAASENLAYLVKADENGSTLCSDTFKISFKIDVIPYPPNITHSWINEGSIQTSYVQPYTQELSAKTMLDCDIQNCCKAVIKDTSILLCNGNNYFLPPNDSLVKTTGMYSFHYLTTRGCDSTWNYNINFKKLYSFNLSDTCLINNQPVTFTLPFDSTAIYKWQDGSTTRIFTATTPGRYWVNVTSACNIFRDTVKVNARCSLPIYLPSGFTPNGDGRNDIFKAVDLSGQRMILLSVYNRYGENIFSAKNVSTGWDGTFKGVNQPPGTYVYIFRYSDLEGNLHTLEGTVVLIR